MTRFGVAVASAEVSLGFAAMIRDLAVCTPTTKEMFYK